MVLATFFCLCRIPSDFCIEASLEQDVPQSVGGVVDCGVDM